jgi:hypothetical protein
LARHEGNFRVEADAPLSLKELLALLGSDEGGDARSREDMIACALAAGDGWKEAVKKLGGAFAEEGTELRERKGE